MNKTLSQTLDKAKEITSKGLKLFLGTLATLGVAYSLGCGKENEAKNIPYIPFDDSLKGAWVTRSDDYLEITKDTLEIYLNWNQENGDIHRFFVRNLSDSTGIGMLRSPVTLISYQGRDDAVDSFVLKSAEEFRDTWFGEIVNAKKAEALRYMGQLSPQ